MKSGYINKNAKGLLLGNLDIFIIFNILMIKTEITCQLNCNMEEKYTS